jgi:hypothetical protein
VGALSYRREIQFSRLFLVLQFGKLRGTYLAYASEPACITYPAQPQGTFIIAPDSAHLGQAFRALSSQILRLSREVANAPKWLVSGPNGPCKRVILFRPIVASRLDC